MTQSASHTANNALVVSTTTAGATTASASIISSINEYAVIIGLGLTVLSIIIGLFFHIYGIILKKNQFKLRQKQDRDAIKAEIIKEIEQENIAIQKERLKSSQESENNISRVG